MSNETLMTDAANTREGAASESADPTATGATTASQEQPPEGQGSEAAAAEGARTEGEAEKKLEGAPESYAFTAPEGVKFDDAVIGAFSEVAKELNLPQDQAQKVLDKVSPIMQARQLEQLQAAHVAWADATRADKELGGDAIEANIGTAKKALDAFATPELRTLLNESGLGNHPEVIRFFYRTGKAISEDRFVGGQAGKATTDARRLYAASNMNP